MLFLNIGLALLVIAVSGSYVIAGVLMIPLVLLVTVAYVVVVFSILVQGTTICRLVRSV